MIKYFDYIIFDISHNIDTTMIYVSVMTSFFFVQNTIFHSEIKFTVGAIPHGIAGVIRERVRMTCP